jgi:hypothetical protein
MMRLKVTILFLLALTVTGCNVCGEDSLVEVASPSNKYVATVYRRSCGATSGFLYHVNVRSSSRSFASDYRGVIEDGQIFLTREGKISISWRNDQTLEVDCNGCPKDGKPTMENTWNDVSISYELH